MIFDPVPAKAQLIAPRAALDYLDSRSVVLRQPLTALQVWDRTVERPLPLLGLAFRLRDAVSSRFGVRRIGGLTGARPADPRVGDRLAFFDITHIAPDILSLVVRDRHLDVMTCITTEGPRATVTASVKVHNWFGRLYMIPVGPAHRLIVAAMLRRLARA